MGKWETFRVIATQMHLRDAMPLFFRTNGRDDTSKSAKAVNTVKRRPPEYLDAVRRTRG